MKSIWMSYKYIHVYGKLWLRFNQSSALTDSYTANTTIAELIGWNFGPFLMEKKPEHVNRAFWFVLSYKFKRANI